MDLTNEQVRTLTVVAYRMQKRDICVNPTRLFDVEDCSGCSDFVFCRAFKAEGRIDPRILLGWEKP